MKKSSKPFLSKQDFVGTGHVFRFTLWQMFKNKANLVSLIIMFVFSLASGPALALVSGSSDSESYLKENQIETIYYWNETVYEMNFEKIPEMYSDLANSTIKNISDSDIEIEDDSNGNLISAQLMEHDVVLHIYHDDETGLYTNTVIFSNVANDDVTDYFYYLSDVTSNLFDEARFLAMGATPEQVTIAMGQYNTDVYSVDEYFELNKENTQFETQFGVQYVYSIIVIMLCMMSASFIIRAIIEEKASKLVELLMVSIQPLAMIVGKILAVMVYVFAMLLLVVIGALLSNTVTGLVTGSEGLWEMLANMNISLSPFVFIIVLISLVLGYFTFSVVAGIAGACCSSMDDVESANMSVVLIVLAGYMVATITVAFESKVVATVTSILPVVSIFCAPVNYICDMIQFPVLIVSWILQVIVLVSLSVFASKIYRELIMYKGNRIKMKQLLGMAFEKKQIKGVK